jgi:hypothetical protein
LETLLLPYQDEIKFTCSEIIAVKIIKIKLISSKMKNWIYPHPTGFLNYTSVLSNSVILLGLPNAPRNLFPNY